MAKNDSKGFARASIKIFQYVVMIIIMIVCCTIAFRFGSAVFSNSSVEDAPGTDMTITVEKGTSISELGDLLEEYNVIDSSTVFSVQAFVYGVKDVKPGTYTLTIPKVAKKSLR